MNHRVGGNGPADLGMQRVLEAERAALEAIAACEEQADAVLRDARAEVRRLVRDTQARISRLHSGCEAKTRELVAQIDSGIDAAADRREPDSERLARAVRHVVRQLSTPGGSDAH